MEDELSHSDSVSSDGICPILEEPTMKKKQRRIRIAR